MAFDRHFDHQNSSIKTPAALPLYNRSLNFLSRFYERIHHGLQHRPERVMKHVGGRVYKSTTNLPQVVASVETLMEAVAALAMG